MSNQIRISTQWLQDCAHQLHSVQDALENAASRLAHIDMDEESGGNKRLSYSLRLRSCGGSYRGGNAREAVQASARSLQALAREVARVMGDYKGPYCVESFEPRALYWLGKADPTIFRGQLAGHVRKDGAKVSPLIDFLLRNLLVNVISRPDFVAYDYRDRHNLSFRLCRSLFRPPMFFWTVRSVEGANISAAAKATPIFEGLDGWTL